MSSISIRSRLLLTMVLICTLASLVLITIGYKNGKHALETSSFNHLNSLRASKQYQIESYLAQLRHVTEVMGKNPSILSASREFNSAFKEFGGDELNIDCKNQLSTYYDNFIDRISANMDIVKDQSLYYPSTAEACYLQYEYIIDNENELGQKHLMTDARDNSSYNETHIKYHEYFTSIVEKFGFYDMFLVDLNRGDIVYSVFKEPDFATNLYSGPYSESNIGKLTRKLKANRDVSKATIVDFEYYRPSLGAPASFIGIPIIDGVESVGALIFQMPISEINKILTGNNNWAQDGLGESGETYLVGDDYFMRSISRFFLVDTAGFSETQLALGLSEQEINSMYNMGSTILRQQVKTDGVKAALNGETATKIIEDYRGVPVLSSFSKIKTKDLNWVILSEIDEEEANEDVYSFQKKNLIAVFLIILLVTFLSMFLAGRFVKSIEKLMDGVRKIRNGNYAARIDIKSKDEFGELASSFNDMVAGLETHELEIEKHNKENEKLLFNFIPERVARQLLSGAENVAEEFQNVSLIFVDVVGFSQLSLNLGPQESITGLNSLVSSFDNIANRHQIEKIRTVGDSYFAASGMHNPRLDHAKKVLEFARELKQVIIQFNINYKTDLRLKIALHSGPVTAGIVGKENFSYDLWGATVNEIFNLNSHIHDCAIVASDKIYDILGSMYSFKKIDSIKSMERKIDVYEFLGVISNN